MVLTHSRGPMIQLVCQSLSDHVYPRNPKNPTLSRSRKSYEMNVDIKGCENAVLKWTVCIIINAEVFVIVNSMFGSQLPEQGMGFFRHIFFTSFP